VASDAAVLRLVVAYAVFTLAEYSTWIGMLVYAFHHGGATASGLVAMAALLPGVLLAPLLAGIADRRSPSQLLVGSYLAQGATMGGVAVALGLDAPPLAAYSLVVLASTAVCATRPAQSALLPAVVKGAQELTAANVVAGWAQNGGLLLAGLVAAVFLRVDDVALLFAVNAVLVLVAAVMVVPVRATGIALDDEREPRRGLSHLARGYLDGARAALGQERSRLLVGVLVVQSVVIGALDVLFVVLAVDVLDQGQSWVGYLNAVYGAGAVVVGVLTAHLLGRRLSRAITLAVVVMGGALALTALSRSVVLVVVLLGMVGGGRALLSTAATTLLQRVVPVQLVGRVFGLVEGLSDAGLAVGAVLPGLLIALGGDKLALVCVGGLLPACAVCGAATLRRIDDGRSVPLVEVALLRSLPHFAELPGPALETLAEALERVEVRPGQVIIKQGDEGDMFYAIADGEVSVCVDGKAVSKQGRGEGFGEIALLRATKRAATVTAIGPVTLLALRSDSFLAALNGHSHTRRRAEAVALGWAGPTLQP
jgi:MFS family permease